ncbi:acylphosphatase-2-like [Leguminivora glycinivorella]|uniref:acylphosphatase-2-like n=1 Tax=Leguminivora glycinivorella TaxID=1035111 RepID=UPI00200F402F|nr:acylphosphatase-2-like [Leguminivora glycinivorella]
MSRLSTYKPPVVHTTDFEVFGKVQGVYFRKYTQKKALDLGVKGWVMNTPHGTVIGQLQGPPEKVQAMKSWLQLIGSPKSKIGKVDFKNEGAIKGCSFQSFTIRR